MHSGPFGCLTKLGGKRAKLVQKFVPRSCVGIFHNECTRSTLFGPKLMFWFISYHLCAKGPLGCLTKLGAKCAELVQTFVPQSRVENFRNERTQSTPLDPKLTFWCFYTIWVHSGTFGYLTKLGAKWTELMQKFVP